MEFEEIKTAIEGDENTLSQVAQLIAENETVRNTVFESVKAKGFEVYDKDSKAQLLNNYRKNVIDPEVKKVHDQYDNDLKEMGFERNQDEKTYVAVKRVIGELKAKAEAAKTSGATPEDVKKRIEAIENEAKQKIESITAERDGLKSKYEQKEKEVSVRDVYSSIKPKLQSDLPSYFKSHETAVLNEAMNKSKMEDGKLVMTDSEGNVLKDNNFNPITVESYLSEQFKDVMKSDKPAGGAGSGKTDSPNAGTDPSKFTVENYKVNLTAVDSPAKLMDQMAKDGLVRGTPQYTEIFAHYNAKFK